MKALQCASALLLLGLGGQAQAASYVWCQVAGGNYESYLSEVVEIEDGAEAFRAFLSGPFGKGFREYVQTSLDPRASNLDCTREESIFFASDHIDVLINANPGIKFVRTGWRGRVRPAVVQNQPKQRLGKGKLLATASQKPIATERSDSAESKPRWQIEDEQELAVYEQELAKQQRAVADYERMKAEVAAKQAELRAKAEKATADWKAAVAACRAGNHSACGGGAQR